MEIDSELTATNEVLSKTEPTPREILTALTNLQGIVKHLAKRVADLEQWVESESNRQMGDDL